MARVNLQRRSVEAEQMDDLEIQDTRLTDALRELRIINRRLGGYSTSFNGLRSFLKNHPKSKPFTILDIGCGGGDFAEAVVSWAERMFPQIELHVTGIDISRATVEWAADSTRIRVHPRLASRIRYEAASAFELRSLSGQWDIAHCSLFMHHFSNDQIITIIKQMAEAARKGIVINDLHRHRLAYESIRLLTTVFGASSMVKHDGPLSVMRAFRRDELTRIASAAGLNHYRLTWHWAFRWLLTAVNDDDV